jgi:hypothetical protein
MYWYESIDSLASIAVTSAASLTVAFAPNLYDDAKSVPFLFTTLVTKSNTESLDSGVVAELVMSSSNITSMKVRPLPLKACLLTMSVDLLLVIGIFVSPFNFNY